MGLFRIVKKHPKITATASRSAATLPASGFTFIDNSQGASAATAELSDALGTALNQIDLDGNPVDRLRALFQKLDTEAIKYTNSKISDADVKKYQCEIAPSLAQLISATWTCALATYTQSSSSGQIPDSPHHQFLLDHVVSASLGGTFKAMTTHIVSTLNSSTNQKLEPFFPALIIAIRGTASAADGIVNLNGEPRDATKFLVCFPRNTTERISAHSGFLAAANTLSEIVEARICSRPASDDHHVIFTGHSAGGAVATLLYLRFKKLFGNERRISCLTFGAPPCVSAFGAEDQIDNGPNGVHLNIVNEFDMVSRVDGPYILNMVNLLRGMYGMNGLTPEEPAKGGGGELKAAMTWSSEETQYGGSSEGGIWCLPPSLYRHVGKIVVLAIRLEGEGEEDEGVMRALDVPKEVLEGLLFCRLEVHKRVKYAERVKLLEEGKVNGGLAKCG
ncbi:Alpha/Beta hydrolase protein [Podospora fimiseda]|uniref:Alpha/Beta hydrolase protein n=1 Tax=Podospora fimiseda TaxID=252190 RepID=A0AAN7BLF6_9PEZI|nr:Alpha/Beta hydrolase protein [Podospora fimiseda]